MQPTSATAALEPGPYESRVLAALAPLWDAPPETLATLRRWAEPLTGVHAGDYEAASHEWKEAYWREWRSLVREGGSEWLVPEPAALGGFGLTRRRALYNEDTLKLFEILIALQFSAALAEPRQSVRPVVWEIGGGWGGLAYQFKQLFPRATYIITAWPEAMLLSASYLSTLYPSARIRFYGERSDSAFWDDIEQLDFVFLPEYAGEMLSHVKLDLAIDAAALELMTEQRAENHVHQAYAARCPYFYTLHATAGSTGLTHVGPLLARWYWPHVIPVPRMSDGEAWVGTRGPRAGLPAGAPHSHVIGWRRLQA